VKTRRAKEVKTRCYAACATLVQTRRGAAFEDMQLRGVQGSSLRVIASMFAAGGQPRHPRI
jgi:hypothetical protein